MPPVVIGSSGITPGSITIGTGLASLYMPTARPVSNYDSGESQRERQMTYARGYKERATITVQGGGSWRWRRIVFSMKGPLLFNQPGDRAPFYNSATSPTVASNMTRAITTMAESQYVRVRSLLFDGQEGIDWTSQFTAKVDTTNVTLHSDKIINLSPGNESGMVRTYNMWTPLNKNLMYLDDEAGDSKDSSYISVQSKIGMGDLYVYDLFALGTVAATGTASLTFSPEGTYYWHER